MRDWFPTPGCNCNLCSNPHLYDAAGDLKMNQTMTRRFYKSHSAFQRPSILKLYSEAVAEATAEIQKGTKEEYYIVEVRAVVRKEQPKIDPIEVIEVKG